MIHLTRQIAGILASLAFYNRVLKKISININKMLSRIYKTKAKGKDKHNFNEQKKLGLHPFKPGEVFNYEKWILICSLRRIVHVMQKSVVQIIEMKM